MGAKGVVMSAVAIGVAGLLFWSGLHETGSDEEALAPVAAPRPSAGALTDTQGPAVSPPASEQVGRTPITTGSVKATTEDAVGDVYVMDSSGLALVGAWLRLADDPLGEMTVSDEEGRARPSLGRTVADFQSGEASVELSVGCEGYVDASATVASLQPLDVTLLALPQVHGRLLDPEGLAVETRGRVQIGVLAERTSELEVRSTESGATGDFRFTGVPRGQLRWINGMAEGLVETKQQLDIALGVEQSERVDLVLANGFVVEGVVVDAATQQPLPGATVWTGDFFLDESDLCPHTTADERGRFRLEGFDIRNNYGRDDEGQKVLANLNLFGETETHPAQRAWIPLPWRADGHYEVVLRLDAAGCSVSGVLHEPGMERPASLVALMAVDASGSLSQTRTDTEGRFRFEGLPPGSFDLFGWGGDLADQVRCQAVSSHLELEAGRPEKVDLELRESERSLVAGQLTDATGKPVSGVPVRAQLLFRRDGLTIGPLSSCEALSDHEGRFEFEGLPPFLYVLSPRLSPARESRPARKELVLAHDEVSEGWDFVVGKAVTFGGSVLSESRPATSLRLTLVEPLREEEFESVRPDAEGRFLFARVLAGRYEIRVDEDGELIEVVPVGPAATNAIQIFLP